MTKKQTGSSLYSYIKRYVCMYVSFDTHIHTHTHTYTHTYTRRDTTNYGMVVIYNTLFILCAKTTLTTYKTIRRFYK